MPPPAASFFADANHVEAALWASMAVVAFVKSIRLSGPGRRRGFALTLTLLAFGGSDVVEAATGAWWRPWWLLVWKGLCLAVFVSLGIDEWKRRRSAQRDESPTTP